MKNKATKGVMNTVDFIALGAMTIQVCTVAMAYGFKIVEDMIDGLNQFLIKKYGISPQSYQPSRTISNRLETSKLKSHYLKQILIKISVYNICRCHIVCEDTSHHAILAEEKYKI